MSWELLPLTCPGDESRPGHKKPQPGCPLTAPVRPQFSTGQQLFAEDLSDLPAWVDARLRLDRYRDGWGAVCGLGVSVRNRDEDAFPALVVHPGYAVSPCGTDMVVPQPRTVCLKDAVLRFIDPCRRKDPDDATVKVAGLEVPAAEVLWLDLYLSPEAAPTQYRPAPVRPGESRRGYEASRVTETGAGEVVVVGPTSDPPLGVHHADPKDPFGTARAAFLDLLKDGAPREGRALKEWVAEWMTRESKPAPRGGPMPLAGGVSLRPESVRELSDAVFVGDRRVDLFALLYLGWLAHAPVACPAPGPDRVRLARVLVWARDEIPHCPAVFADPHPPYRRPYGPTDLPPGAIDLRPYYGAWYETVGGFPPLTDRLKVVRESIGVPTPDEFIDELRADSLAFAFPGDTVVARVWNGGEGVLGQRVLRFAKPPTSGAPGGDATGPAAPDTGTPGPGGGATSPPPAPPAPPAPPVAGDNTGGGGA